MQGSYCVVGYTPSRKVLSDGSAVEFRLLSTTDQSKLTGFFLRIPESETESLRDDVHDPEVVSRWITTLDYQCVLPLIAWDETTGEIAAVGSLHRMRGVYRFVADIRVVVDKTHRNLGLGSIIIKELIELAVEQGLHVLRAEIPFENDLASRAFRQLGFEQKCILEGYFVTLKGKSRDVVLMLKRLQTNPEEDFFFVF
jgi:L-amino acid N-acyltransferase YncA